MFAHASRTHRVWVYRVILVTILGALFALMAIGELSFQHGDELSSQSDFVARVDDGAHFISTYEVSVLHRATQLAKLRLSGADVSKSVFEQYAQDLQFGPTVLVDARGRVLDAVTTPSDLPAVGLAMLRAPITAALRGTANVSQVTMVQHQAIVFYTVPFSTPEGVRVVSGTMDLSRGPMVDFLQLLLTSKHTVVYVTDDSNRIIAAPPSAEVKPLPSSLAHLKINTQNVANAHLDVAVSIPKTPWKLTAIAPLSTLYASIDGVHRLVPWLVILGFAVLFAALGILLLRSWEKKLRDLEIAGIDPLTKLDTRRQFFERVDAMYGTAQRYDLSIAALMIDVDNFKDVNDQFGHYAGDRVLEAVAECLRACLRGDDVAARWGGEEFAIVLPFTTHEQALRVAERVRTTVAASSIDMGDTDPVFVTVSIGVAARAANVSLAELLPQADSALFQAKDRGRNRVESFVATP